MAVAMPTIITQTASPNELISMVSNEYDRRLKERLPWELEWRLNIAFIDGRQLLQINPVVGDLEEITSKYWWEEREVFNQIAPIIEARAARLGRMRPILKVRPPSPGGEDRDRASALVGTIIVSNTYDQLNMPAVITESIAWLEATGTVCWKFPWKDRSGRIIGYAPVYDDETGEQVGEEPIYEGEIDVAVVPPHECFPDSPWHDGMARCRSFIHARAMHVNEIDSEWGVKVEPDKSEVTRLQQTVAGLGNFGHGLMDYRLASIKLENHAIVKEFWELPTRRYPNGRLIIVAGQKVLYYGDLPYKVGPNGMLFYPFVRIQAIRNPGCFWGRCVTKRLIPVQRRWNAVCNREAEYLNRCAIGVLTYEDGSIDEDTVEQDGFGPGGMIPYKKGYAPPRFMDNPQLPQAFFEEKKSLLDQFTQISGVSEFSRLSHAPPDTKSGIALQLVIEQDDTRLSHTADNIKDGLIEAGKIWLRHYKQRVKVPRLLEETGKEYLLHVTHWSGTDIRSENVVVEGISGLVESISQKRQMVFDLLKSGLFNDPRTGQLSPEGRARLFEMLQMGDWEEQTDIDSLHINRADRENLMLIKGQFTPPASYDDHVLHIARHNRARLKVEYEEAVGQNPAVAQAFEEHISMHIQAIQATMPPAPAEPKTDAPGQPGEARQ